MINLRNGSCLIAFWKTSRLICNFVSDDLSRSVGKIQMIHYQILTREVRITKLASNQIILKVRTDLANATRAVTDRVVNSFYLIFFYDTCLGRHCCCFYSLSLCKVSLPLLGALLSLILNTCIISTICSRAISVSHIVPGAVFMCCLHLAVSQYTNYIIY